MSDFCKSLKSGLTKSVVMLKVQESIFVGLFLPQLIAMPSGNLQFCLVEPMWIQEMLAKKKKETPGKQELTELKGSRRERKRDRERETIMAATLFPINEAERAITMGTNVRQSSAVLPTLLFA